MKVGSFGETITIMPEFTNDVIALRAAVPAHIPESAPTPLWRAVDRALGEFGDASGRRVVLVLSDGKDSRGFGIGERFVSVLDVIERAQREDVMVYAIGMHSRMVGRAMPMGRGLGQMLADDLPEVEGDEALEDADDLADETDDIEVEVEVEDDKGEGDR